MTYPEVLAYLSAPHLGWTLLTIATVGDALLPLFLGLFVQRYSHLYEPMSALGAHSSPVGTVYRKWLVFAGIFFLAAAPQLYYAYRGVSETLSCALAVCIAVYGIGACILAGFFPAEDARPSAPGEWIHGIGAAVGFLMLTASPLLLCILQFACAQTGEAVVSAAGFGCSAASFVLFVLSDKVQFAASPIGWAGLWQRLAMVSAYVPLICTSAAHL